MPEMEQAETCRIRVGPAGWSYEDWKGIVYPRRMPRGGHPLRMLSTLFDTVEINASFYRPVQAVHSSAWLRHVSENPGFTFTAKLWEGYTHQRGAWPAPAAAARVREGFRPLLEAGKFGGLLAQFPWSFQRTPENRVLLARVLDEFADFPLVAEVRHASWDHPNVFAELQRRGVAFCNIDQPDVRGGLGPTAVTTCATGYVRLHGRNRADWFRADAGRNERYDYLYDVSELDAWATRITAMARKTRNLYVVTNNHFEGQAVANALELQARLGLRRAAPPASLIDRYPRLSALG